MQPTAPTNDLRTVQSAGHQSPQPTEAFCELTQLGYLVAGEAGPATVLLHGWGAFKELWWSTLTALAPHMCVFAPDMPGHGTSSLGNSVTMPQIAERIATFCTARGLKDITLVGHSMGGNIAIELALLRPQLVRRLILVSPATEAHQLPAYTRSYLGKDGGWAALRLTGLLYQGLGIFGRHVPHLHGGGVVRPVLRRAAYHARHDVATLRTLLVNLFDNSIGQRSGNIAIPTLVVSGEYDMLVPQALSRQLAQSIPGAQYKIIHGASHNPMDERPAAFERVILEFSL